MSKRPYRIYDGQNSNEIYDVLNLEDLDFQNDLILQEPNKRNSDQKDQFHESTNHDVQLTRPSGKSIDSLPNPNANRPSSSEDPQNDQHLEDSRDHQNRKSSNKQLPYKEKGKLYSKNYRQKKKQMIKTLQEETKFLKQKIDDLSFRLRQTELQLIKLRHSEFHKASNVQTMKLQYMKQIESVFQNKQKNLQKIKEMQQKFTHLNCLASKQKMDLLTYYRNQFFDVLISDVQFYLLNGLIDRVGLSRESQDVQPSLIDLQVYQIYQIENFQQLQVKKILFPQFGMIQIRKYKKLIQTLYQDYCKVIAQGNLIQKMWQPPTSQLKASNVCKQTQNFLKLEIYFQKIKYRKDMRELRQSWFVDPEKEEINKRSKSKSKLTKVN